MPGTCSRITVSASPKARPALSIAPPAEASVVSAWAKAPSAAFSVASVVASVVLTEAPISSSRPVKSPTCAAAVSTVPVIEEKSVSAVSSEPEARSRLRRMPAT